MTETSQEGTPVWARTPVRRRPALSREAIVAAAIEIADAEGLEAVSIRRVAAELGVRAMSLYTHIDSKDDLLDLMKDEVSADVVIEGELPDDWREAISVIERRTREMLVRRPWAIELSSGRSWIGPNQLRHVEQSLAAVSGLTTDPVHMVQIVAALDHFALGYAMREIRLAEMLKATGQPALGKAALLAEPYYQELLRSGRFPYLAKAVETGLSHPSDFELGLRWLLDGIERDFGGDNAERDDTAQTDGTTE